MFRFHVDTVKTADKLVLAKLQIKSFYNHVVLAILTLRSDTRLYYSSDGLPGLGGFDLFYTELKDGEWSEPQNLMYPINSPYDEVGIVFNPVEEETIAAEESGYFSSNREGGTGGDDIYSQSPERRNRRPFRQPLRFVLIRHIRLRRTEREQLRKQRLCRLQRGKFRQVRQDLFLPVQDRKRHVRLCLHPFRRAGRVGQSRNSKA